MAAETPTQRLAGLILGEPLEDFVRARRAEGRPWRHIARDLWEATSGDVDVTHETLRTWYPDTPAPDTAAEAIGGAR